MTFSPYMTARRFCSLFCFAACRLASFSAESSVLSPSSVLGVCHTDWLTQARLRCTACTLSHCSEAALLLAENSRALLSDTLIDGAPAAFVAGGWA